MSNSKRALVTGAEGFIGSHLVRFLAGEGFSVTGTCRLPGDKPGANLEKLRFVHCDLANGQQVTQLMTDLQPTYVFHLGAQSLPTRSWEDPVETFQSNIMGSLYLFEAARRMKSMPVIVSACSSAEYGHVPESEIPVTEEYPLRPLHPYGISKVCLDLLAREYFLDYQIPAINVRLFNTTGAGKTGDAPSDFVRQIVRIKKGLQEPVIEVGNLETERAFLDVVDTAWGFYLAALKGKPGEAYNLCADKTHRMRSILHSAMRVAGVEAEVRPVERLMRPSDEKVIFGTTRKFHADTGWAVTRTIEDTLKAMIEYWDARTNQTVSELLSACPC